MSTTLLTIHDLRLMLAQEDTEASIEENIDFASTKCCEDCQMRCFSTLPTIQECAEDDSDIIKSSDIDFRRDSKDLERPKVR
jgi:hypothetical protein